MCCSKEVKMRKELIKKLEEYYEASTSDQNSRFKSWEYCYETFVNARNKKTPDIDYLSLHLAQYLASWGMYRNSFLLQKDYKIHYEAVTIILNRNYDVLVGIDCEKLKDEKNIEILFGLSEKLTKHYDIIRKSVEGKKLDSKLSQVLITKILLGTLGCVPAYDEYFKKGIRKSKIASGTFSENSIKDLIKYYEENSSDIEKASSKIRIDKRLKYPQMKVIDMMFWQYGKYLEKKQQKEKHKKNSIH